MSINDADDEEERVHVSGAVPVVRPYRLVDADDDEGDDALEPLLDGSGLARDAPLLRTHWETILVVLPLFAGYAALFALQAKLKALYLIADEGSSTSKEFGVAASFVYLGNLVFRIGHNFIFACVAPRRRVQISIGAMALSMATLGGLFLVHGVFSQRPPSTLVWAFVAYGLGGISIGTFESNLLSVIAPLGKASKAWAIYGMPLGIVSVTVGGFAAHAVNDMLDGGDVVSHQVTAGIYATVLVMLLCSFTLFTCHVAPASVRAAVLRGDSGAVTGGAGNTQPFGAVIFANQLREWRRWWPQIWLQCAGLLVDMFFVSLFSPGVLLYVYKEPLPLFINGAKMSADVLKAVYNALFCLGDFSGRRLMYDRKRRNPFLFLILTVLGIVCGLSNNAYAVPLCGFLVAFGNGAIYAQSARRIDKLVPRELNLTATSVWLFLGDFGSVTGSNCITYVVMAVQALPWFADNALPPHKIH